MNDLERAKAIMGQVRRIDIQINNKLEELAKYEALAQKITTTLQQDASFGSGNQDKLGDAVAKITDLENEIRSEIDALRNRRRAISEIIERVPDDCQMDILQQHYLLHKSLKKVAGEMHMTVRNVRYIHGSACQAVADILKEDRKEDSYVED